MRSRFTTGSSRLGSWDDALHQPTSNDGVPVPIPVHHDVGCPETVADDVIDVTRLRRDAATLSDFMEGLLWATVFAEYPSSSDTQMP